MEGQCSEVTRFNVQYNEANPHDVYSQVNICPLINISSLLLASVLIVLCNSSAAMMFFTHTFLYLSAVVVVNAFDMDRLSTDVTTYQTTASVTDVYQAPTSSHLIVPSMTASVVTISFNGRLYINTAYFPVTSTTALQTLTTKTSVATTYTTSDVQNTVRSNNHQRYVTDDWELYQGIANSDIVVEAVHDLKTTVESLAYARAVFTLVTLLLLVTLFSDCCLRHINIKLTKIFCKRTLPRPSNSYDNQVFDNSEI